MNTNGFGGKNVSKSATIFTNDEKNHKLRVTISGKVEKFVSIAPRTVNLKGVSGKKITSSVKITPEDKYPFKIVGKPRVKDGKSISFKLEEKKSEKPEYLLTVENTQKENGRYSDIIYLKTDSEIKPEIEIRVYGSISEDKSKKKK